MVCVKSSYWKSFLSIIRWWILIRKMIQSCFSPDIILFFLPFQENCILVLIKNMQKNSRQILSQKCQLMPCYLTIYLTRSGLNWLSNSCRVTLAWITGYRIQNTNRLKKPTNGFEHTQPYHSYTLILFRHCLTGD